MIYVQSSSAVPYSVEKMFYLVNDINSYTEFIPGCNVSKIVRQYDNNELIAEIHLVTYGLVKSLTTRNLSIKNQSITIFLVKGPFKSFYGNWKFIPITDSISRIEYSFNYEFNSKIVEKIFIYFFERIGVNNIINIFVSRAHEIYGV